jgi:hypothetical protein
MLISSLYSMRQYLQSSGCGIPYSSWNRLSEAKRSTERAVTERVRFYEDRTWARPLYWHWQEVPEPLA